jgi:hypothetical protein
MRLIPTVIVALAMGGCAIPGPHSIRDGESQADVRARLGAPAAERKLASGDTAWYYITGPSGFYTYRVDFGGGGSVKDYEQVLTMKNFMSMPRGASADAVLDQFGPPMERMKFARTATEVWTYRWIDGTFEMLANAEFGKDGKLVQITVQRDPAFSDSLSPG